ncbi:MAG: dephospho-CoA kinase [Proteobacteria bacterium]|nr:dephospho-CoA kinase [Pseudomonadota bacterium]MDA0926893.1 dephospho-CoA kinase [Pseudomonadota bacterium]
MYVVGLTGGIGSGKSTVSESFARQGIEVIDADQLAREAVATGSPALAEIASHFGQSIINSEGSLNRRALRAIVFADEAERRWLERLLHPIIGELLKQRLSRSESSYTILESPLLLETSQKEMVDRILVVDVSEDTQLQRAMLRDGSHEETIRGIIASQISRDERLDAADEVINNEGAVEEIDKQVSVLHKKFLRLAKANG